MPVFSRMKKYARKATKAVGKRYKISYGRRGLRMSKSSLSRIDKDVQMIKSRLNVEKKFKDGSLTTGTVAQVDVNAPGYFTSTLTPLISLGTSENERVGGSIKLTGLRIQMQVKGQIRCNERRRFKVCVVSSTDSSVTNVINDLWDDNPLTGIRDYYSNRNYSNNPRAHKILRTIYFSTPNKPAFSTADESRVGASKSFGLKLQQLTRFEGSSNQPKDMNYFLIMFADGANSGSSNSTNSGVLQTTSQTGLEVQEYFRWFYVDN